MVGDDVAHVGGAAQPRPVARAGWGGFVCAGCDIRADDVGPLPKLVAGPASAAGAGGGAGWTGGASSAGQGDRDPIRRGRLVGLRAAAMAGGRSDGAAIAERVARSTGDLGRRARPGCTVHMEGLVETPREPEVQRADTGTGSLAVKRAWPVGDSGLFAAREWSPSVLNGRSYNRRRLLIFARSL